MDHPPSPELSEAADRAASVLVSGMQGNGARAIEQMLPSRVDQGRLYLLGALRMAQFLHDLKDEDIMDVVDRWSAEPRDQLRFAARLSMRRELAQARGNHLEQVEAAVRAAESFWD